MFNAQYINYWFTKVGMNLMAMLPFSVLYGLSDFLYVLLRYVVGYRKKVVRTNLRN